VSVNHYIIWDTVKKRSLLFTLLLFVFFVYPVDADEAHWTEKKLGTVIIKADNAARKKKWARAIKFGEQMLIGSNTLDKHSDARYINLLKNLNKYYYKATRLNEISPRVIEAYQLSKEHLGPEHNTTIMSRNLYYKLLTMNKKYQQAIPLVLENISIFEKRKKEEYRLIHYLKQLYSLYGLTDQFEKEEETLLKLLETNRRSFGNDDEDNIKIILSLAQNYCHQKKLDEFNQLITSHHLKYYCSD